MLANKPFPVINDNFNYFCISFENKHDIFFQEKKNLETVASISARIQ